MQSYSVSEWIYMSTLYHLPHIFRFFFLINVAFRVRCNVPHREDDFLFHGSNRKNFIKIPLTNLDRGKNPSMFWVSLVSRRLPIFSWQTLQWKWLHSEVHHQVSICTWCALNTASSCFLFLFSPFSLRLSPNWFLFRNFSSLFFFFGRHYGETLCFFNILNIALFHDSVVCIDISARAFMVGFLKKNYVFWNWNKRNSHFPFKQIP